MSHYNIEPGDDGRCDIHHGVVKAVGQIPHAYATSYAYEDRQGRVHSGVQWDHHVEREVWIAAPGGPDRRFILGEGFGVLPGHELVLACAPGCIVPFRAHNLSTGQLFDVFQLEPYPSASNFVFFALVSLVGAVPLLIGLCLVGESIWGSGLYARFHPLELALAAYLIPFVFLQFVMAPSERADAARRLHARRLVDDHLAAFEAQRSHAAAAVARDRPLALEPALRCR